MWEQSNNKLNLMLSSFWWKSVAAIYKKKPEVLLKISVDSCIIKFSKNNVYFWYCSKEACEKFEILNVPKH